jgi:hypothetical protein
MHLDEEAQKAEAQIVGRARKIKDVATLKRILHESLTTFEKALNALPTTDREEAFSLYLDKIRRVTFGFHYVILRRSARKQFGRNPSHGTMQSILASHGKNMREIAQLYRFL